MTHTREVTQPLPELVRISAVVTPTQKRGMEALARANERSFAAEVRRALAAHLERENQQKGTSNENHNRNTGDPAD